MRCDYAKPLTTHTCRGDGRAVYHVTVRYNPRVVEPVLSDHVHLCAACAQWVKRDARPRRYKVTAVRMAIPTTTPTSTRFMVEISPRYADSADFVRSRYLTLEPATMHVKIRCNSAKGS